MTKPSSPEMRSIDELTPRRPGTPLHLADSGDRARARGRDGPAGRRSARRMMRVRHCSNVDRGLCAVQFAVAGHFPRGRLLLLSREASFADPAAAYARMLDFLGLDQEPLPTLRPMNANAYEPIDRAMRTQLGARFAAANEDLYALLGERFPWTCADGTRPDVLAA